MNKDKVREILTRLEYTSHIERTYLTGPYNPIDYGLRQGTKVFKDLLDAARQFPLNGKQYDDQYIEWHEALNDPMVSEETLLCTVLEIFDWGKVLTGNVKEAVNMYKEGQLKQYISGVKDLLARDEILPPKSSVDGLTLLWSSGWTKVYSFIDTDIIIYDSRVSAFLNHTLTYEITYDEKQLEDLRALTSQLYNFGGNNGRRRLVESDIATFKKYHPNKIDGFNANLVSSWIVQELHASLSHTIMAQAAIRDYERAFFMLGFDLDQLIGNK